MVLGTGGMSMTNFGQFRGYLQSAAVRSFLVVMASAFEVSIECAEGTKCQGQSSRHILREVRQR
jgi:hypothetical protein